MLQKLWNFAFIENYHLFLFVWFVKPWFVSDQVSIHIVGFLMSRLVC